MKRVLVPIATGVEEMEATIVTDILRRAEWTVTVAGLTSAPVTASRGIRILPDCSWDSINPGDFGVVVIPGGAGGTEKLLNDRRVIDAVSLIHASGGLAAAVCAGPLVLHRAGILQGKNVTSHPSVAKRLEGANWIDQPVVVDGNIITSQGAGTTFLFALEILRRCDASAEAAAIAKATLFRS